MGVCGLDYPFTMPRLAGVRCCPSSLYTFPKAGLSGLARDCHFKGFPDFEQFYIAGFPARTQWPKSVASTSSATPAQPGQPIVCTIESAKQDISFVRIIVAGRAFAGRLLFRFAFYNIDGASVDHVLNMCGIVFLDHLHTCSAVLCDLINICALKEAHRYICVPQAVECAGVSFSILFHIEFAKQRVEQLALQRWEHQVGRLKAMTLFHAGERMHRAGHGLGPAGAALSPNGDMKDALAFGAIRDDFNVPEFKPFRLVGRRPVFTMNRI